MLLKYPGLAVAAAFTLPWVVYADPPFVSSDGLQAEITTEG